MSITTEISRIQADRNTIRAKLVELNLAVSTATLDALAAAIDGIVNRGTINANVQEGETYTVEPGYYAGGTVAGVKGGGNYALQEKTTTPTKKAQTVVSDSGYYGLSTVVVNPIPENYQDVSGVTATAPDVLLGKVIVRPDGSVVVGTMPSNGTVNQMLDVSNAKYVLTAGYYAGGTISITVEEKTVTPTKSEQVITPSTGKVLSKVKVAPIPDAYQDVTKVTATAPHVLAGDIFVDAEGKEVEGTMARHDMGGIVWNVREGYVTVKEGYHLETESDIPDEYHNISGVTATAPHVLAGDIFVNAAGDEVEGTMPDNGDTSNTFDGMTTTSVNIPAGYTTGGTVSLTNDIENALKAI